MTASEILSDVNERYAEWLEMHDNPAAFVAVVLANKIAALQNYIDYLEKRSHNASSSR